MNKKQRKTLEAIFEKPIRFNVRWDDIENYLLLSMQKLAREMARGYEWHSME
jgi:hypothetical protein